MGTYSFLDSAVTPVLTPFVDDVVKDERRKFQWRRRMEAWKYGSGNDYELPNK